MNLIFLGPPGAGKGTIAAQLRNASDLPHISTGDLFRAAIKNKTALGTQVASILEKGELVPDAVTVAIVKERLAESDAGQGYILDGFPRTIPQAEALETITKIDTVVNFNLADEEIVKRLTGRRLCRNCGESYHILYRPPKVKEKCDACGGELYIRDDDKEEAIHHRLKVYKEQTAPLIDFYRKKKVLVDIDAAPSAEEVAKTVQTLLKED